jgi:TolB-like protein
MTDVFISYAREDRARVEALARALEAAGLSVWWDRRIDGGAEFAAAIERALNDAAVALCCWTKSAAASRWVRDEAEEAAERGKLIPVLLDGERAPIGFRQLQAVDLSGWRGDANALTELVDAVRKRTSAACATAPAEAPDGSIAVLPFVNLSGDSTCQHFCDAVGADIISLLARNKELKVLARGESFSFRDRQLSVAEIGRRLNVRYVIDGTIRRSETSARITADLVLASTGQLLWSGQSEGKLDDVFALQDEMARHLASVVAPELARFEREAAARKSPDSLTAWECAQRGAWHLYKLEAHELEKAERWFSRAIALDPSFPHGHAGLANAYVHLAFFGARSDRALMVDAALKSSAEAVRLAPDDAYCRFVHARALAISAAVEEAIAEADAAIALNPSSAHAWYAKAWAQAVRRETACEAVANFDRAIEMSPKDPLLPLMHCMKALACLLCGDLAAAEAAARCAVRQHNATTWSFATLTAILGLKGAVVEAAPVVRQLREKAPSYNCAQFADDCFFIDDRNFVARFCEGLRAAGLS